MPSFAEGLAEGKAAKQEKLLRKELIDLQVKETKAKLERVNKQQEAAQKFQSLFGPSSAPQGGIEGPPQQPAPGKSFVELLSDPEGQILGLMSGIVSPKDIGLERERQLLSGLDLSGGGSSLGFTPESQKLFKATRDPKQLKAIEPVQKVVQTPDGPRIHSLNPRTGKLIADLGPAKEEKMPVGDAGKIKSIEFAKQEIDQAIALLSPDGKIDQFLVAAMSSPIKTGAALEIEQLISDAIATKVLVQSGVTAREDEVKRAIKSFVPGIMDLTRKGLAERKLQRLRDFMSGALDLTVLPPSLRKKIEAKKKQKKKPSLILKSEEDVTNLSDEELKAIINGK